LKAEEVRIDFSRTERDPWRRHAGGCTRALRESRFASPARTSTREEAIKVGREVDGMAVSGIAHTGKRVPHQDRTREVIGVWSSLVPREQVPATDHLG
jgi:hypothetical protein